MLDREKVIAAWHSANPDDQSRFLAVDCNGKVLAAGDISTVVAEEADGRLKDGDTVTVIDIENPSFQEEHTVGALTVFDLDCA